MTPRRLPIAHARLNPAPRLYFTCSQCTKGLLDQGAERARDVAEISLGQACDLHPSSRAVQATSAVRATLAMSTALRDAHRPASHDHLDELDEPKTFAAVERWPAPPSQTEIATRFALAWSGDGVPSDDQVTQAAAVARRIYAATKGK